MINLKEDRKDMTAAKGVMVSNKFQDQISGKCNNTIVINYQVVYDKDRRV